MSEPWVEWLEWLGLAGYPPFKQPCNMISLSFLIAWQSQGRRASYMVAVVAQTVAISFLIT